VIGITCYVEPVSRGDWPDVTSAVLPHTYVANVERAGGIALLVSPRSDMTVEMARELLARLDGLVITGGPDVDPSRYAAVPHPRAQAPRPERDATEIVLAAESGKAGTPLLGICRGMQVMAVAAGGTLEQHVPDRVGDSSHAPTLAAYGTHRVTTVPGTRVAALLGDTLDVPTYHHQSVLTHPGYVPAGWTADGTLEAMEDPTAAFRLGVQWHPEQGSDPRLFEALVAAALEARIA
jgi:putative glutamine amidotransferase